MSGLWDFVINSVEQVAGEPVPTVALKDNVTADGLKEEFIELSKAHEGVHNSVNVFDGKEHGYIELGGWLDSQAVALLYMGMGHLLGIFDLFTPREMLPTGVSEELIRRLEGCGLITVIAKA